MQPPIESVQNSDSYFKDGRRRVDYVLVVTRISALENTRIIERYIKSLQKLGLDVEQCYGITVPVVFIKLHMPEWTRRILEKQYPAWNLAKLRPEKAYVRKRYLKFFESPALYLDVLKGSDQCGKIYYLHKLLSQARYGFKDVDQGLNNLIDKKIILKAYPLHDGRVQHEILDDDEDEALLNDRSLLAKYWANPGNFYKIQPIDLIKKYYGLEIAFYFAWSGYYVQSLTPLMFLSLLINALSAYRYYFFWVKHPYVQNLCEENTIELCGMCFIENQKCYVDNFHHMCATLRRALLIDNSGILIYGAAVSIWAGIMTYGWRIKEHNLRKRWNLLHNVYSLEERFAYSKVERSRQISKVTGHSEAFTPRGEMVMKHCAIVLFLIGVTCLYIFMMMLNLSTVLFLKVHFIEWRIIRDPSGAHRFFFDLLFIVIQLGVSKVFRSILTKLCVKLAYFVNQKYQAAHYQTYLTLRYICASVNHYMVVTYFAFIKGQFYNIPYHDSGTIDFFRYYTYDTCQPHTCMENLYLMIAGLYSIYIANELMAFSTAKVKAKKIKNLILPQYEIEFHLESRDEFSMQYDYTFQLIMHGILTFYAPGNSLGGVFQFLLSIIKLREDAQRFIHFAQRPIPKILYNMDFWTHILTLNTFVGVFVNSCVIAFTSETLDMKDYGDDITGYFESRLSQFDKRDLFGRNYTGPVTCYYRSLRYPPGHTLQYQLTMDHWALITRKLVVVVVFHLFILLSLFIFKSVANFVQNKRRKHQKERNLEEKAEDVPEEDIDDSDDDEDDDDESTTSSEDTTVTKKSNRKSRVLKMSKRIEEISTLESQREKELRASQASSRLSKLISWKRRPTHFF